MNFQSVPMEEFERHLSRIPTFIQVKQKNERWRMFEKGKSLLTEVKGQMTHSNQINRIEEKFFIQWSFQEQNVDL